MVSYDEFLENLARVHAHIEAACRAAGRKTASVRLLPVTKNHPAEAPLHAWRAGLHAVGENRVQEAADKRAQTLVEAPLSWELIGHLQSNKARLALGTFTRIQSVDSLDLALRLERIRAEIAPAEPPFPLLLEVNTGEDPNKFGFATQSVESALEGILKSCPHLSVDGLMTVAPLEGGREAARPAFAQLRALAERLRERTGLPLPELSMGMSGDLEEAVAEGATLVRVGTALFGERNYGLNG